MLFTNQIKLFFLRLISGILLVLSLGSCLCTAKPIEKSDAFEPNNTIEQAKPLTSQIEAELAEGAVDTFAFTAIKDERIRFDVATISGGYLAFKLEIKTPNGELIATKADRTSNSNLEFVIPNAGNYILVITGVYTGPPDSLCATGQANYRLTRVNLGLLENPTVTATLGATNSILIEWNAVPNATSYTLERQVAADTWQPIPVIAANQLSAKDSFLKSETNYVYRLKAWIGDLSSTGLKILAQTYKPLEPRLSITTPIGSQYLPTLYVNKDITLSLALNDSPGTTVTIERSGTPAVTLTSPYLYNFLASDPSIIEGEYTFSAIVSRIGESERSSNLVIVVDRTRPTVLTRLPEPNATLVPINSRISVTLSEELVVRDLILEKTASGDPIPSILSGSKSEFILTPNAPLESGVSYTVRLPSGASLPGDGNTDRAGNAPVAEMWTFTTQP